MVRTTSGQRVGLQGWGEHIWHDDDDDVLLTPSAPLQGFTFLKLDFLHSAALPAKRHNPRVTRAQAMQLAMRTLREAVGEEGFLMACSCPLGSAVGWADGARVSADTSERWGAYPIAWDKTNAPSARNAVRNTVARQAMHRRWFYSNPDCLVLREGKGSFLKPDQVRAKAMPR